MRTKNSFITRSIHPGLFALAALSGCSHSPAGSPDAPAATCQSACASGTPCQASELANLDGSSAVFSNLAVDDSGIYWANQPKNTIVELGLGGGATTAMTTDQSDAFFVAVDASNVYWTVGDNIVDPNPNGAIRQVAKTGGAVTELATGQATPQAIIADGASVFWADYGRSGSEGSVMRRDLTASAPTKLADADSPYTLALDATDVYWTSYDSVMAVAKSGGTPRMVAYVDGALAGDVVISGDTVYWDTQDPSGTGAITVWSAPSAGGTAVNVATVATGFSGLASGCDSVYWGTADSILRSTGGGSPQVVASGISNLTSFVVVGDTETLFWTQGNTSVNTLAP